MDAVDASKVLARRWPALLAGLAMVAAAGVGVLSWVPTAYQASGQLLLLLPVEATGASTPSNPYLNAPAGLTTTASLLAGNAGTDDAQRAVAAEGLLSEYSVSVVPGAGPLVVVLATGTDPADVVATRDEVMVRLDTELSAIQQDVDVTPDQFVFTAASAVTEDAEVLPGSRLRALVGVSGAGLVLVLLVVFGMDRWLLARRQRRPVTTTTTTATAGAGAGPVVTDPPDRTGQHVQASLAGPVDPVDRDRARRGRPVLRDGAGRAVRP